MPTATGTITPAASADPRAMRVSFPDVPCERHEWTFGVPQWVLDDLREEARKQGRDPDAIPDPPYKVSNATMTYAKLDDVQNVHKWKDYNITETGLTFGSDSGVIVSGDFDRA